MADCIRTFPFWRAHSCFQGYVEIVGYNQRTIKGGWLSPSSPALVKVLQSESGGWGSSDWTLLKPTHILVCCLFALMPLSLTPPPLPSMHILFSRKRFFCFPCGRKERYYQPFLTWSWHCLYGASCRPEEYWCLDILDCSSFFSFYICVPPICLFCLGFF